MSSYLSNLLTNTTSRYNTLRRTLLSNEEDGDTEDDSHVSRVLRAYYTEKARPFPPWLPPDPNDRRAITPQPTSQQGGGYFTSPSKNHLGGVQNQPGTRSSLSDLWDPPSQQPINAPAQPQSLRAGRRPGGVTQASQIMLAPPTARPLPSQREGSYQSIQSQHSARSPYDQNAPGGAGAGGSTAQERLKARLWGGSRSNTPNGGFGPGTP